MNNRRARHALIAVAVLLGMAALWMPVRAAQSADVPADPKLLFHADFNGRADAVFSKGDGRATLVGTPTYIAAQDGKALLLTKGVTVSYAADDNLDVTRGKLTLRFKPAWLPSEKANHMFLTATGNGYLYLGYLEDKRLVINMFDTSGKEQNQHYPQMYLPDLTLDQWHEVTCTWDIQKGVMQMTLDGKKTADYKGDPWPMAKPAYASVAQFVLSETAEIYIADLKIWSEP